MSDIIERLREQKPLIHGEDLDEAAAEIAALRARLAAAQAERDALRADAERYRWLRKNAKRTLLLRLPASYAPNDIDAALDAARATDSASVQEDDAHG